MKKEKEKEKWREMDQGLGYCEALRPHNQWLNTAGFLLEKKERKKRDLEKGRKFGGAILRV